MRVATTTIGGAPTAVRIDGDDATPLPFAGVHELLASGPDWRDRAAATSGGAVPASSLRLETLIPQPEKVICAGLNFAGHIVETGRDLAEWSKHPMLFAKYWRSLLGPVDDLVLPANSTRPDWEAEVALVIGRELSHVEEDEALEGIAGFTVINDVSMRDWQIRTPEMLQGKTFDGSTPLGPVLVTGDELDQGRDLRITCYLDDEKMQDGSTSDMVFSHAQLVSYCSQFTRLMPGDVIATGTPSGIGATRKPPVYLEPGKTMRSVVDGIGECVNLCVAPKEDQ